MRHGEVWWMHVPDKKPRPACILTRDDAIPGLTTLLVAPATSTQRGIPTEVALDVEDGMPRPCVLSLDGVIAVPKSLLTDRITRLSPVRMHAVCGALILATGC